MIRKITQPCPFKHAEDAKDSLRVSSQESLSRVITVYAVSCDVCRAMGPSASSSDEAISLWNERTPAEDIQVTAMINEADALVDEVKEFIQRTT